MNETAANPTSGTNESEQNWKNTMSGVEFNNGDDSMNDVRSDDGDDPDEVQTAPKSEERPSTDTEVGSNGADEVSINTGRSDHDSERAPKRHPGRQARRPETAMDERTQHAEQGQNSQEVKQALSYIDSVTPRLRWLAKKYADFKASGQIQKEIDIASYAVADRIGRGHITEPLRQARDTILNQCDDVAPEDPIIRKAGVLLDIANMKRDVVEYYEMLKSVSKIESDLNTLRGERGPWKLWYKSVKRFNERKISKLSNLQVEMYDEAARKCRTINEMAQRYLDELGDDNPSTSPQTPNANDSTNSVPPTPTSASKETTVTHGSTPSDSANSSSSAE